MLNGEEGARRTVREQSPFYECWAVTDGRAGVESQALGLAEAVARLLPVRITVKRVQLKAPWKSLPRAMWGEPFSKLSPAGSLLRPPFPDLWIGCGRHSTAYTIAVKLRSPKTFTVQAQAPRAPISAFDLVTPPLHDRLEGENVFPIIGSPNRATAERLAHDAALLAPEIAALPKPRVAVLLGGPNRAFSLSPDRARKIAESLRSLALAGAGLMITASRRTPPYVAQALSEALDGIAHFSWSGAPVAGLDNPYFGILGLADHILVTEDSVNMATEAAGVGKPLYLLSLDRSLQIFAGAKFRRFQDSLTASGIMRRFQGNLENWSYRPLNETARAADEIVRRFTAASAKQGE